jgi:hypothetical protein
VAFSAAPGTVDAAVFGAEGMSGEGVLAVVHFRVIAAGDPGIRIASVDGRDARNRGVAIISPTASPIPAAPKVTQLAQPHPNPFVQMASISFAMATAGPVELTVYSVDGRRVRLLARDVREAGEYSEVWDGRSDDGIKASPGVYYVQLSAGQHRFTRTLVYLK